MTPEQRLAIIASMIRDYEAELAALSDPELLSAYQQAEHLMGLSPEDWARIRAMSGLRRD